MPWLKAVEVLVLVLAGGLFVWWQWRDVSLAQARSRREREAREREAREQALRAGAAQREPQG